MDPYRKIMSCGQETALLRDKDFERISKKRKQRFPNKIQFYLNSHSIHRNVSFKDATQHCCFISNTLKGARNEISIITNIVYVNVTPWDS